MHVNLCRGRRSSAVQAHLAPVCDRASPKIETGVTVRRIQLRHARVQRKWSNSAGMTTHLCHAEVVVRASA